MKEQNKPIPKGEVVTGNVVKHLDSRFLNSLMLSGILSERKEDFLEVTIDRVEFLPELKYENGQIDKDALLLYFRGSDKPLKLCKTNTKQIARQLGPIGEQWHGKKIALVIDQCRRPDLGGKNGDCIRVRGKRL